ncbi:MAG: chorismate synthase [Oscillospiraceae bacterium]|nr:chorismate synthase [Oscillospiraceae bacterium]
MNNSFGRKLTLTLFGESHGSEIGCVIDGLRPGLRVEEEAIARRLRLRRPAGEISTARVEPDPFRIVSGVYRGYSTGTPLCILIPNLTAHSADYDSLQNTPRPGHADYTGFVKYRGFADPRGGGHFSGRLTAPLVAAGAIFLRALAERGVFLGTHIARCGGISDRAFGDLQADLTVLEQASFPVLEEDAGKAMTHAITEAARARDSLGGVLETAVIGLPAGLGDPWFDTLEGLLSHGLFSIPAVKGVEFGDGFALAEQRGSHANDPFRVEDGRVVTVTNHNGGINGGISNGMPLLFRTAVKPTPSIALPQRTVDVSTGAETTIQVGGRHDPCIVPRAVPVAEAVAAIAVSDFLLSGVSVWNVW